MTEANDSVDSGARPGWRWDVALSFAGARRGYVEQVAQALKARGVRCFYDADEEIELWGKYLAEELPAIYGEQAAAVVIFVSAEYAARDWTRHERRAALGCQPSFTVSAGGADASLTVGRGVFPGFGLRAAGARRHLEHVGMGSALPVTFGEARGGP